MTKDIDILSHNRRAWNRNVERGNEWTVPVSEEVIAAAREGRWSIILTPTKPIPREWFPALEGLDVLCLASGGGQQGPILAATGADVTVLDNSPRQLAQDRLVAERDSLTLATVEGDMADLSMFADGTFGLIVHPISNSFAAEVRPVWREAFRVLRPGGVLIAGFMNPAIYLFDDDAYDKENLLRVTHSLPYSDTTDRPEKELQKRIEEAIPLEFSHTLEDQIGGQLDAGFVMTGFYEDRFCEERDDLLSKHMAVCMATRSKKP